MARTTEPMEGRIVVRTDPEFKARVQRVADERFGTNISVLARRAIERLIEPIEAELAETAPRPIVTDTDGRAA